MTKSHYLLIIQLAEQRLESINSSLKKMREIGVIESDTTQHSYYNKQTALLNEIITDANNNICLLSLDFGGFNK